MRCCVCQKEIVTENPKRYFCKHCWNEWNDAIRRKETWITFCINYEHRLRRQELEDSILVYGLGDRFDISEDGKLIPLRAYYEQED